MDRSQPLSSFPPRPLDAAELDEIEGTDRMVLVLHDEERVEGTSPDVFASNCVFVTEEHVSAAVYLEDDETWYRVYREPRPGAELRAAYETIRGVRGEDGLFSRGPLTVSEAVFEANRQNHDGQPGYEAGDEFDCPVCGETHTVEFYEDGYAADATDLDSSHFYVTCPDARNERLIVAFRAVGG